MGLKPITLMVFPLALYMAISIIFNNATAWHLICGSDLTCQAPFVVFSVNGPLMLVLSGRLDIFWGQLVSPSTNLVPTGETCATWNFWPTYTWCHPTMSSSDLLLWIIGIFGGGVLAFIALGLHIHFEGASLAVEFGSSGDQSAKLAQGLGIGLLIWVSVYSAFGGWEAYLDQAAVGLSTVFDLIMSMAFITGVLWFTQSRV